MRRYQAIVKLEGWCDDMIVKISHLERAGKLYSFIKYFFKGSMAVFTVVLLMLSTFLTAEIIGANNDRSLYLGLSISICVFQVLLSLISVVDSVMTPGKKSNNCRICAKSYAELYREICCVIDDLRHPDDSNTNYYIPGMRSQSAESIDSDPDSNVLAMYNYLVLMYSTKEQLILNIEPPVLFSMAKKNITIEHEMKNIGRRHSSVGMLVNV